MAINLGLLAQAALDKLAGLAEKTLEAGDAEKFANGVQQLGQGLDETYSLMKKVVVESTEFTDEEKLQKLQEIADKQAGTKQLLGDEIKDNRDQIGEMVTHVFRDFVECGVNIVPQFVRNTQEALEEGKPRIFAEFDKE